MSFKGFWRKNILKTITDVLEIDDQEKITRCLRVNKHKELHTLTILLSNQSQFKNKNESTNSRAYLAYEHPPQQQ